ARPVRRDRTRQARVYARRRLAGAGFATLRLWAFAVGARDQHPVPAVLQFAFRLELERSGLERGGRILCLAAVRGRDRAVSALPARDFPRPVPRRRLATVRALAGHAVRLLGLGHAARYLQLFRRRSRL